MGRQSPGPETKSCRFSTSVAPPALAPPGHPSSSVRSERVSAALGAWADTNDADAGVRHTPDLFLAPEQKLLEDEAQMEMFDQRCLHGKDPV